MKKLITSLFFALSLIAVVWAAPSTITLSEVVSQDYTRYTLKQIVSDAEASLEISTLPTNEAIAIIPIANDNTKYLEGLLTTAITDAGLKNVVPNDNNNVILRKIASEIEFDERKSDILDAATISKFGELKSTQILLQAIVHANKQTADNATTGIIELELHAYSIATKEHLWGNTFAKKYNSNNTEIPFQTSNQPQGKSVTAQAISEDAALANRVTREAIEHTIKMAETAIASSAIPQNEPIAMLPIAGDKDQMLQGLISIAISKTGRNLVVPNNVNDYIFDQILHEIKFDERRNEVLDSATISKFGSLQSSQYLFQAIVRVNDQIYSRDSANKNIIKQGFVELEMHCYSIKTKQHIWGDLFSTRYYVPGGNLPQGISNIPADVRNVMTSEIRKAAEKSLESLNGQIKDKHILQVPLSGDSDSYANNIIRDVLNRYTQLKEHNGSIFSVREAHFILKDNPTFADGVFFGTVRDMSKVEDTTKATPFSREYIISVEIQAEVEDNMGRVLWSDTINATKTFVVKNNIWTVIGNDLPYISRHPICAMLGFIVAIILVIIIFRLIAAATRVR